MKQQIQRLLIKQRKSGIIFMMMGVAFLLSHQNVYGANAEAYFGSNYYEPAYGETFPIGIYLESDEIIGEYEIHLSYDTAFLEYSRGAAYGGDGEVVLSGDLQGTSLKILVYFESLAAGETTLTVESVEAVSADGSEILNIAQTLPAAPIRISASEASLPEALYCNGVEVEDFEPEETTYELTLAYADELQITDESGALLELQTVEETQEGERLLASYTQGEVPMIYTFHITWEEPVTSGTVDTQAEEDEAEEAQVYAEEMAADETAAEADLTVSEAAAVDADRAIAENKQKDMIKAGLVLAALFAAGLIAGLFSLVRGQSRTLRRNRTLSITWKDEMGYEEI